PAGSLGFASNEIDCGKNQFRRFLRISALLAILYPGPAVKSGRLLLLLMNNLPVESRFKYGRDQFDDIDVDDLAGFLSGSGADSGAHPDLPRKTKVDEDVFGEAGDRDRHYGR